jgi:hypothetical protein
MMAGGYVVPVITGLAIGIGFILVFSLLSIAPRSYEPRISERQAAKIIANHLEEKWNGFVNYGIYTPEGYLEYDMFHSRGFHLPLVFVHESGTQF